MIQIYNSGENIFFTSDSHFFHRNIIKFCNRPFNTVEEMNLALIDNWNNKVPENGIVYHLGDFVWGGPQLWDKIVPKLNGKIHLVKGNHDDKKIVEGSKKYFESVSYQQYICVEGKYIYLNHYPFLCYGGTYLGNKDKVWQLFGHVHSRNNISINFNDEKVKEILGKDVVRLQYLFPTQYDVGVDNNNYTPVSFYEVKEIIQNQINKSQGI